MIASPHPSRSFGYYTNQGATTYSNNASNQTSAHHVRTTRVRETIHPHAPRQVHSPITPDDRTHRDTCHVCCLYEMQLHSDVVGTTIHNAEPSIFKDHARPVSTATKTTAFQTHSHSQKNIYMHTGQDMDQPRCRTGSEM